MISFDDMNRIDEEIDGWINGVIELDDNDMRDKINYDYLHKIREEINSYLDDDCETDNDRWLYCALRIWDDYVIENLGDEDAIDIIQRYIYEAQKYLVNAGTGSMYFSSETGIIFDDPSDDSDEDFEE